MCELCIQRQITNYTSGCVNFVMSCCFSSGGLLTVPERCDVLTSICICFPNSSASLSNFHLRGSMLPNRFSRAWSNLSFSCDLGKDLGISQSWLEPVTAVLICCTVCIRHIMVMQSLFVRGNNAPNWLCPGRWWSHFFAHLIWFTPVVVD